MTPRAIHRFTVLGSVLCMVCAAIWSLTQPTQAQPSQSETPSRCGTALPSSIEVEVMTTANNELIALSSGKRIYVCGFTLDNDTAGTGMQFVYGTGTACATNETDLTGIMTIASLTVPNSGATQFATAASTALCLELNANTAVNGFLTYVQY